MGGLAYVRGAQVINGRGETERRGGAGNSRQLS